MLTKLDWLKTTASEVRAVRSHLPERSKSTSIAKCDSGTADGSRSRRCRLLTKLNITQLLGANMVQFDGEISEAGSTEAPKGSIERLEHEKL